MGRLRGRLIRSVVLLSSVLLLTLPDMALAVQQHGGIEGMVSHQLGHLLFIFGMLFLLYRMNHQQTMRLTRGPGWFEFKMFIWFIVLWNMLTFYGHWHQEIISRTKFIQSDGKTVGFIISSPLDILFYFSRLDHLVLLPAFLFLLRALRKWRQEG